MPTASDLIRFEAALRLHRRLLRRRLAAFAALAAAYTAWAGIVGGWAWLPAPLVGAAGALVLLQARAAPGRDFRDALMVMAASALDGTGQAARMEPDELADAARRGLIADAAGWTVTARFSLRVDAAPATLVSLRHAAGQALLLGWTEADRARALAWPMARPPLRLSWETSAADLRRDLECLRRARDELARPPPPPQPARGTGQAPPMPSMTLPVPPQFGHSPLPMRPLP